jgi:hypothetical protein
VKKNPKSKKKIAISTRNKFRIVVITIAIIYLVHKVYFAENLTEEDQAIARAIKDTVVSIIVSKF